MSIKAAIASLFKRTQVKDTNGDSSVNANFIKLETAFQKLGPAVDDELTDVEAEITAAYTAAIAAAVAAIPVASNPRQWLEQQTGTGPWTFATVLNGDATDIVGYEIAYRFTKTGVGAFEIGLRINGDTGAAKYVTSATTGPSVVVTGGGVGGANQVADGIVSIPLAKSGAYRTVIPTSLVADDTPQVSLYSATRGAWLDTSVMTSTGLVVRSGTVTSGQADLFAIKRAA